MFNRILRLLAVAAVALPLAACAPRDTGGTATTTTTTTSAPAPETAATGAASPMAGMDMSSPGTGMALAPDADGGVMAHTADRPFDAVFLEMMVRHHQQAVRMAQDVLPQANRPEVKQLAQAIIASQQEEIQKMQDWRQDWYPDIAAMTDEQMSAMMKMDMPSKDSKDTEQRFLAQMIPHHQKAIRMSQEALQQAEHPELRTMARGIIEEQEKEIAQMQAWSQEWTAER